MSTSRQRRASLTDVVDVVKGYAIQETIGPLKGLGRWIGLGLGGAACIGFGLMYALVGLLRLLQTETGDTFAGDIMRVIPYVIVLAVTLLLIAVIASRIKRTGLSTSTPRR